MQPRSFLSLLILTLAAVAAAAVVLLTGPETGKVGGGGEPAFPRLLAAGDSASDITLASGKGTVHLVRGADGAWSLPDKGGFPADPADVRLLLVNAAKLTLAERKTDNPDRLAKLWLEDPSGPKSASARMTVTAGDGTVLADAIIGRVTSDLVGQQEGGTYLRYPDQTQAWLAAGKLNVSPDPMDYVNRGVVSLPSDTVRRVVVTRADGQVILAERAKGDPALVVKTGLAEGQVADPKVMARLAGLLDGITFNDVAKADAKTFPSDAVHVTVTSFDGIEVRLDLAIIDDEPWARVSAALAEEHSDDAERLKGTQDFIDKLAAKTAGWAYQISQSAYDRLAPTPESLVKAP